MVSQVQLPPGAGVAAAVWIALWTSHQLADHWAQTGYQALNKGGESWVARRACAGHVSSHMIVSVACLMGLRPIGLDLRPMDITAGLTVIAISHYWADRRSTLRGLAAKLDKEEMYRIGEKRDVGVFVPGPDGMLVRARVLLVDEANQPLRDPRDEPIEVTLDNPSLGTGAYALDQSWHFGWLYVAALVITTFFLHGW